MCLPPKTGCTNWQRGMVSLLKNGDTSPEELSDYEVFYDLERFNSTDMRKERMIRGSQQGYLTMVNTRHPLARLLSAWHDKFRKGHPWLKFIESKYGDILKILERRDMTLEKYAYSFESFMELAAASNHDWMRFHSIGDSSIKKIKNSPNFTMMSLSVSKLKNAYSHSRFEDMNFRACSLKVTS